MTKLVLIAAMGLGLSCTGAAAQAKFGATMRWCGSSPEFALSGVPKGTATLDFRMVDLDVPGYPHGGAQMAYEGQRSVACSELGSASLGRYQGPSPPAGQVHTYEWTIKALDAGGRVIGQAVTRRKFPE
jgi:phosphatidylethanolamine-binding protein (PEBP) family uncharacterized protein